LEGFKDVCTKNGSSKGQNLALTGVCVPSSVEGDPGRRAHPPPISEFILTPPLCPPNPSTPIPDQAPPNLEMQVDLLGECLGVGRARLGLRIWGLGFKI
jgi:hypothetical protein